MPQITTLANGIRIISHEMKETETVSISIWAGVGSRYELPEQSGISHFLEHMAFKGTSRRNARQIAEEFDNIGGYSNAGTGREYTTYYAKILKDDFEKATDILCDILLNSTFDEGELEKERGVILQEIAMINDTPDDVVFDFYQQEAFPNQPVGRPIIGYENLVKKFTRQDIINYTDKHYYADNMVFSVAGNISHERVVKFASNYLSSLKNKSIEKKEPAIYQGGIYKNNKDLEQVHFIMGFKGLSYNDDDIYKIQILSGVLGGGMSSRLFQEIRENRGLAYSISSFTSSYYDNGLFTIYAGTAPEQLDNLIDVTIDEIKKVIDNVSEEELNRSKAQVRASLLMGKERSTHWADEMGKHLMCFGRHIPTEEILTKVAMVDTKSVAEMMQRVITESKPTIAAMGKIDKLYDYDKILAKLQ